VANSTETFGPEEAQADLGYDDATGVENTAPPKVQAVSVTCAFCGDSMVRRELPRFSRSFGIVVLVVGLLLSIFMMLLLGLPLVLIGTYMASSFRSVWACGECGAMVDRHDK